MISWEARIAEMERRAAEQLAVLARGGRPIPLEQAGDPLPLTELRPSPRSQADDDNDDDPGPLVQEVDVRAIQTLTRRWAEMRAKTEERLVVVRELGKDATAPQIVAALAERGDTISQHVGHYLKQRAFGATKPKESGWQKENKADFAAKNGHGRLRLADPDNNSPEQTHAAPPAEEDSLALLGRLLESVRRLGGLRKAVTLLGTLEEVLR